MYPESEHQGNRNCLFCLYGRDKAQTDKITQQIMSVASVFTISI